MSLPDDVEKDLSLPVTFTLDGSKMVTLGEFLTTEKDNSIAWNDLSPDQIAEIVIERLKAKARKLFRVART